MRPRRASRCGARLGARLRARLALASVLLSGCAYYNVLYNANQKFDEAQVIKIQSELIAPDRLKIGTQEERLYTESFEKAARVVRFYPTSKWVDDALLLMGLVSIEKGDYSTATRKFEEILTIFPNSNLTAQALLGKGRTLVELKDYDSAIEALLKAREFGDKKIQDDVIYFLGLVEERKGNTESAKEAYTTVLEKHRKSEWLAEAGLALGRIQVKEGKYSEAAASFDRVRKKGRTSEEKFVGGIEKGLALLEGGDFKRARNTFHDLGERATNDKQRGGALLLEAKTFEKEGDPTAATRIYKSIIVRMPRTEGSARAQYMIAKRYDDEGDYPRAMEAYQLVNEQGTGFEAWRDASARMTEIQKVLDLRAGIANQDEKLEERQRKQFLLAEQLLEEMGDVDGALTEYATLAREAEGTELGARALYAEAWVREYRLAQADSAEAILLTLSRDYRETEVGVAARQRFGMPVWKVEEVETKPIRFVYSGTETAKSDDPVVSKVEPRAAKLPDGVTSGQVWVRVSIGLEGEVVKATVTKSLGEDCDAAALEAANATKFQSPADGGPAVSVMQYDFPPKPKEAPPVETPRAQASDSLRTSVPPDSATAPGSGAAPASAAAPDSAATSTPRTSATPDSALVQPPTLPSSRLPSGAPAPPKDGEFDPSKGD